MLREFYSFIAKKINSYFQISSSSGLLHKGDTLSLKLDDDDMVKQVYDTLKEYLEENGIVGEFEYKCLDGSLYHTYTLKCVDNEVVIAAQIDGMSTEFLCANLRNAANEAYKPILLISSDPIDSAISGSRDMASSGMPFYADNLMLEIKEMIEESTQLTTVEKSVLQFELDRKDVDVFSDKNSLFEYRDLLSIMSSGKVNKENFPGFRLFTIDGKADYQTNSKNEVNKFLKQNNELYERIDRSIRIGNLEADLSDDFDDKFIQRIENAKNSDGENWSRAFTYHDMLTAMAKKQEKKQNPLQIDKNNISVYGSIPFEQISYGENLFIRDEGTMTTKKRTRSLLIFNSEKYTSVSIRIDCNVKIPNNGISADDATLTRDGKDLVFVFSRKDITFHKIELRDETNAITYIFKICILDLPAEYMISTIKTNFSIDYKKKATKSKLKLLGISTDLIFNKNAANVVSEKLEENKQYRCNFEDRLHIFTTEEELSNIGSGINIEVNFAGIVVSFALFPDETKSTEIIGRGILRGKFAERKSFEFVDLKQILMDSQEYFAKENLLKELRVERQFLEREILSAHCDSYHDVSEPQVDMEDLTISEELREAYYGYMRALLKANTVPTLAYLSGDLLDAANEYVDTFLMQFDSLIDGQPLTTEQVLALRLGTITVGVDEEILFTPLHPLNVVYQIMLLNEECMKDASDIVIERLNSINLLPYIRRNRKIFKVSDQLYSLEWKHYAPVENKKYMGGRRYVPKLIEEKITEFVSHFKYIFEDINNKIIKINLINMGDCAEVFVGIAQFFIHSINRNADVNKLMRFEVHVYSDTLVDNAFLNLKNYSRLKKYLSELKLTFGSGIAMSDLEGVFSKNVDCYFHNDNGKDYKYAHISFYEMESEITSETATMDQIETGISLGGILSGIPSSKYGQKYRTGFGTRYAKKTDVVKMAELFNSLIQVDDTGNPYNPDISISTQIDSKAETKMDYIYDASNWVVFVEPKVDLDFFSEKEASGDLLIIHYSDQYTSSSGYDAITVTHKSEQYTRVIQEYLNEKAVAADVADVKKIINLFNAVNGDWLLRLISSKRMIGANKDSTFSREKISIVAAIKFMLAYLKHPDIIWVPISMEEMLRVSGGAGLSQKDGVLSYKNLGFDAGPTSDDLLFVGLHQENENLEIYFYPTEVKTGNNDSTVMKKAIEQAKATAYGFDNAFCPTEELEKTIMYKVNRNFMMQLIITSCKKMKVYHVDDSQDWDIVLDKFRQVLLNEEYTISKDIQEVLGIGAVLSFKKGQVIRKNAFTEDKINIIEMPETDEFGLILKTVKEIVENVQAKTDDLSLIHETNVSLLTGEVSNISSTAVIFDDEQDGLSENEVDEQQDTNTNEQVLEQEADEDVSNEGASVETKGISIHFGMNQQNGQSVIWEPNNTDKIFHTNTGIIGTMGTGKTQFTQSVIAQLYQNRGSNVLSDNIGILIFDYKGDYNENKIDFMKFTDAKIYKPYHLPFNPLALTWSGTPKPLLPVHTANTFVDTLSKVYPNLGPKQKNVLLNCIDSAYTRTGINKANFATWNNEAPTFSTLYQIYEKDEEIKKGDVLEAALSKIAMFEIFEPISSKTKGLYELLDGVVVIDLSGYDSDIQNLVVAITLDLFYSQMQAAGHSKLENNMRQLSKLILVDEADNFLREGYPSLRKILKEGREFGVGTILSTQFLKHFVTKEEDYSKYILTWVVHNVADLAPGDVRFVFNTLNGSSAENQLCSDIKNLKKHESILKIGNMEAPIYMRDKAFWEYVKENS